MKSYKMKMLAATVLVTVFVLSGCAGKDEMGMDDMKKGTMESEMKNHNTMEKMNPSMMEASSKKMNAEMNDAMKPKMDQHMDTTKSGMDTSMENDMKKTVIEH